MPVDSPQYLQLIKPIHSSSVINRIGSNPNRKEEKKPRLKMQKLTQRTD